MREVAEVARLLSSGDKSGNEEVGEVKEVREVIEAKK